MSTKQSLIAAAGLGLTGVVFWTGTQRPAVSALVWNGDSSGSGKVLLQIGGELTFVFVLWLLAGQSDGAGMAALAFIVGLWLLWAIQHYAKTPTHK
jgi:hypothetical protein